MWLEILQQCKMQRVLNLLVLLFACKRRIKRLRFPWKTSKNTKLSLTTAAMPPPQVTHTNVKGGRVQSQISQPDLKASVWHNVVCGTKLTLTRSWRRRYTSTCTCWQVQRGSRYRRAADTPRRDRHGQRWGRKSWGSERTGAAPPPGAGGSLSVWSPAAHSSASYSTERAEHQGTMRKVGARSKQSNPSPHRILFSSCFLSFSSFCSTFRMVSRSCSSRKEKFSSSVSSSIGPSDYTPPVNSAKRGGKSGTATLCCRLLLFV